MNTSIEVTKPTKTSLATEWISLIRYYVGGRRGLILLTLAVLGAGLVFNWNWLVAIGAAPLLLALAPCAIMCGLGLCMNKMMGGKSCSTTSSTGEANAEVRSSSAALDAEKPNNTIPLISESTSAALVDDVGDSKERAAVPSRSETMNERS